MLISIETHITSDFQEGPDPLSPSGSAENGMSYYLGPNHFIVAIFFICESSFVVADYNS